MRLISQLTPAPTPKAAWVPPCSVLCGLHLQAALQQHVAKILVVHDQLCAGVGESGRALSRRVLDPPCQQAGDGGEPRRRPDHARFRDRRRTSCELRGSEGAHLHAEEQTVPPGPRGLVVDAPNREDAPRIRRRLAGRRVGVERLAPLQHKEQPALVARGVAGRDPSRQRRRGCGTAGWSARPARSCRRRRRPGHPGSGSGSAGRKRRWTRPGYRPPGNAPGASDRIAPTSRRAGARRDASRRTSRRRGRRCSRRRWRPPHPCSSAAACSSSGSRQRRAGAQAVARPIGPRRNGGRGARQKAALPRAGPRYVEIVTECLREFGDRS